MSLLEFIVNYKYIITLIILTILLIILLILLRPKKVSYILKDEDEKTEIEKVIEALESNTDTREMTTFEEEQEASAIISYQELVEAVKEKKALMEVKNEKEVKEEVLDIKKEPPKFKNSEFISPIFGKATNGDDFLKELKDFRSNL